MAAGATRMVAVLVPDEPIGDTSVISSAADVSATVVPVLLTLLLINVAEQGAYEETEDEEDVDVDDEVEATAVPPEPDVVVAVAASTSSQLGLQNFELRWRFRLLCICVL